MRSHRNVAKIGSRSAIRAWLDKALPTLCLGCLLTCASHQSALAGSKLEKEHGAVTVVTFPSADDKTLLTGYLFEPSRLQGRSPAVVLMHGRAGAYSSLANGVYDAGTLTHRFREWAGTFTAQGIAVLLVDGFGPRGYPAGFAKGTYNERPDSISEVDVRPLDAYGALRYLRTRREIDGSHVGLMGWSNGASATLVALADGFTPVPEAHAGQGFEAGAAMYPGCGLQGRFARGYRSYAPVRVLMGSADDEVSYPLCARFVRDSEALGAPVALTTYPNATHDFDDPGEKRQSVAANRVAKPDAIRRVLDFFKSELLRRG